MADPVIPDTVIKALEAIRTQIDVVTTLSSGGVGAIILTWARVLGILDDANLSAFKRPVFLILPLVCLVLAIIIGYLAGALTTGYYLEVANGMNALENSKITNAKAHFFVDYEAKFHWMMLTQLCTSIAGIVLMAGWFSLNVFGMKGVQK